jgi:hypothetical protein
VYLVGNKVSLATRLIKSKWRLLLNTTISAGWRYRRGIRSLSEICSGKWQGRQRDPMERREEKGTICTVNLVKSNQKTVALLNTKN